MSLALFFIGLVIHVHSLHPLLSWAVLVVGSLAFSIYLGSIFLPSLWIDCPYRIPILFASAQYTLYLLEHCAYSVRRVVKRLLQHGNHDSIERPELQITTLKSAELSVLDCDYKNHVICDVILWLHDISSNSTVSSIAAAAIAGLPQHFSKLYLLKVTRSRMTDTIQDRAKVLDNYHPQRDLSRHKGLWLRAKHNWEDPDSFHAGVWEARLLSSIQTEHNVFVEQYINSCPPGFYKSWSCGKAMEIAIKLGKLDLLNRLLHRGASTNVQEINFGNTLQVAAKLGDLKSMTKLLENGANVCVDARGKSSALQAALVNRHFDLAKVLIDHGADVNAHIGRLGYPLHLASFEGQLSLVDFILNQGADVNAQGGRYGYPLQAAAANGEREVAELLLNRGAEVNSQGGHFENALLAASSRGFLEVVKLLLERGADVNAGSIQHGNALQITSHKGYRDIVELLLANKADVNAQGGKFQFALYAALYSGHLDIVRLLLANGADAKLRSPNGNVLQAAILGKRRAKNKDNQKYEYIITILRRHMDHAPYPSELWFGQDLTQGDYTQEQSDSRGNDSSGRSSSHEPALLVPDRASPGLFGPRSPRNSVDSSSQRSAPRMETDSLRENLDFRHGRSGPIHSSLPPAEHSDLNLASFPS